MTITATSFQLNLPPVEVKAINRKEGESAIPVLSMVRRARELCGLKQASMAAYMGISEPLLSAQLSDADTDKHLSLRRLSRVTVRDFWALFALLLIEDCGLSVQVLTPQERDALLDMHSAITRYAQVSEWRQRP